VAGFFYPPGQYPAGGDKNAEKPLKSSAFLDRASAYWYK